MAHGSTSKHRVGGTGRPQDSRTQDGRTQGRGATVRAPLVAGAVLVVLCAPVALALVGPFGSVALLVLVVGAAVLYAETIADRARSNGHGPKPAAGSGLPTASALTAPAPSTDEAALSVAESSDEELCWEWRRSFAQLVRTTDAEAVARLAQRRRGYLDELERRHPARFAAWISSGARAAGDPTPFFRPTRTE